MILSIGKANSVGFAPWWYIRNTDLMLCMCVCIILKLLLYYCTICMWFINNLTQGTFTMLFYEWSEDYYLLFVNVCIYTCHMWGGHVPGRTYRIQKILLWIWIFFFPSSHGVQESNSSCQACMPNFFTCWAVSLVHYQKTFKDGFDTFRMSEDCFWWL